ncbi:MAG: NAD(P)H-dependent glycerol-3-phosphate dehydrogenase, partial [Saezia sp.]
AALERDRENKRFLPGIPLHESIEITTDLAHALKGANLIALVTPMGALRDMLSKLEAIQVQAPVICLSKGIEPPRENAHIGLLAHQVAEEVAPNIVSKTGFGIFSGPSFAKEVALGQPTAVVIASNKEQVCHTTIELLHSDRLRIYRSSDPIGVEVGGAVKNILAIAAGLLDGMQLGLNARAALLTRGLAEMARFGVAMGAQPQTFMGLSGLGDLVLTATGDLSRNRTVGLKLAEGKTLNQILQDLGHVAEGVYSARSIVMSARHLGVEMPISEAVVKLLDGELTVPQALESLMQRDAKAE